MSFKELLEKEMEGKQMAKIIYTAEKPFDKRQIKILYICIYAIVHDQLEALQGVLEDEGYIKKD